MKKRKRNQKPWKDEVKRLRIVMDEKAYEGSPSGIIGELRQEHFHKDEFLDTESFLRYMQFNFKCVTGMPCELPEGTVDERARAMLERLAEIGALEILENG
jgi:hypothetical protein